MQRQGHGLRNFGVLIKHHQWKEIGNKIRDRLFSTTHYYGLLNRLEEPPEPVAARIPTRLRALRAGDVDALFDLREPGLSHAEISERLYERCLVDSGIQAGYVAVTERGEACAALWLIPAAENVKLRQLSNGNLPRLADDELLLEGLFTHQAYRDMHIMVSSIVESLSEAKSSGATKVLAFVEHENTISLRALRRCGFVAYAMKRERRFLFFRSSTIEPLPARGHGVLHADADRTPRPPNATATVDPSIPPPIPVHSTIKKERASP